jgi:hypothetical protein
MLLRVGLVGLGLFLVIGPLFKRRLCSMDTSVPLPWLASPACTSFWGCFSWDLMRRRLRDGLTRGLSVSKWTVGDVDVDAPFGFLCEAPMAGPHFSFEERWRTRNISCRVEGREMRMNMNLRCWNCFKFVIERDCKDRPQPIADSVLAGPHYGTYCMLRTNNKCMVDGRR